MNDCLLKMKKLKIRYLCLLSILTATVACEKEIPFDQDNFEPHLVINCILDTDTNFIVQLSHTSSMSDTLNTFIENATIELWKNNELLEILKYKENGIYQSENNKPEYGNIYKIKAAAQGFKSTTASDTLPLPVSIIDAYYFFHWSDDINKPSNADMIVEFEDTPNTENYYELIFYTKDTQKNWQGNADSLIYIDYYNAILIYDPILISEGDIDYKPITIYFSDKLFNGKRVKMVLNIDTWGGGYINGEYDFSGECKISELRSISHSYYQYLKKWTRHLFNQGISLNVRDGEELRAFLFTGEPVNMYTNVENGFGIFAGYSKSNFIMRMENKK